MKEIMIAAGEKNLIKFWGENEKGERKRGKLDFKQDEDIYFEIKSF